MLFRSQQPVFCSDVRAVGLEALYKRLLKTVGLPLTWLKTVGVPLTWLKTVGVLLTWPPAPPVPPTPRLPQHALPGGVQLSLCHPSQEKPSPVSPQRPPTDPPQVT